MTQNEKLSPADVYRSPNHNWRAPEYSKLQAEYESLVRTGNENRAKAFRDYYDRPAHEIKLEQEKDIRADCTGDKYYERFGDRGR